MELNRKWLLGDTAALASIRVLDLIPGDQTWVEKK